MKSFANIERGFISDSIPYAYHIYGANEVFQEYGASCHATFFSHNGSFIIEGEDLEEFVESLVAFLAKVREKAPTALKSRSQGEENESI